MKTLTKTTTHSPLRGQGVFYFQPFKTLSIAVIALSFLAAECEKEKLSPIDQLPPATQTGANTFGCLINGEAFKPSGSNLGGPILSASYILYNGKYGLSIGASRGGGGDMVVIAIFATEMPEPLAEGTYSLISYGPGNISGAYKLGLDDVSTTEENPGTLVITKLDTGAGIISGTFEFTVTDIHGNTIEITDGRFDMDI